MKAWPLACIKGRSSVANETVITARLSFMKDQDSSTDQLMTFSDLVVFLVDCGVMDVDDLVSVR